MIKLDLNKCFKFMKHVEGLKLQLYYDSAGLPTIGIGHLLTRDEERKLKDAKYDQRITEAEAISLFKKDFDYFYNQVIKINSNIIDKLTHDQLLALCSLVFNIGEVAWKTSNTCKLLNQGQIEETANRILTFNKITINGIKKEDKGLNNRRLKEHSLWKGNFKWQTIL